MSQDGVYFLPADYATLSRRFLVDLVDAVAGAVLLVLAVALCALLLPDLEPIDRGRVALTAFLLIF